MFAGTVSVFCDLTEEMVCKINRAKWCGGNGGSVRECRC